VLYKLVTHVLDPGQCSVDYSGGEWRRPVRVRYVETDIYTYRSLLLCSHTLPCSLVCIQTEFHLKVAVPQQATHSHFRIPGKI